MTNAQKSGYFRLAVDLLRSTYGTIPHPSHAVALMFQPKDRVTVPAAGGGRVEATVVTVFCTDYTKPQETAYGVCVHLDGDADGVMSSYPIRDVEYARHDTRPADSIADFCYYPAECDVCGMPPMQGSLYCSENHRKIVEGEPTTQELALDM